MNFPRIDLDGSEIPKQWYNIRADLNEDVPPLLHTRSQKPVNIEKEYSFILPPFLTQQEISKERWIDIPEEVLDIYRLWRPTPLVRAKRFEAHLRTPARIYYKYEGASPSGSHKLNSAIPQVFYNKQAGASQIVADTGAGQWGSAVTFASNLMGLDSKVFMVKSCLKNKKYRRSLMEIWKGDLSASPSDETRAGRAVLKENANSPGCEAIAASEAIERTLSRPEAKYAVGSLFNFVLLHQTMIGLEAKKQLARINEKPDTLIACVGAGSNFGGLCFPFLSDILDGKPLKTIAVEPKACPTLTRGKYGYDFGNSAKTTPWFPMYTLGHSFVAPEIHAGGLRYHGVSPLVSHVVSKGLVEPRAYFQSEALEAGLQFARCEGFVPSPESAYAIKAVMDEANQSKEDNKANVIVFCFSGHGLLDLKGYDEYLAGKTIDEEPSDEEIAFHLENIKEISN